MELRNRIRARREALGLSQTELAHKLGYADRSAVAKIEAGVNDLTQTKIEAFAAALGTTPGYLMAWTDDPYDYEQDPDDRLAAIPSAQFEHLLEQHDGDLEAVWDAWSAAQEAFSDKTYVGDIERTAELINNNPELTDYLEMLASRPECRMLFSLAKDATKADVEKAVAIVEALRKLPDVDT